MNLSRAVHEAEVYKSERSTAAKRSTDVVRGQWSAGKVPRVAKMLVTSALLTGGAVASLATSSGADVPTPEEIAASDARAEAGTTNSNDDDNDNPHSYDEVGTNVLMKDATIRGTKGDDKISVKDNEYNREVVINGQTFVVHRTPGEGVSINGGDGDDTISGTEYDDRLSGGAGDDVLHGLEGNDRINGGTGNDSLNGNKGDDLLSGGAGNDVIYGGAGNDQVDGGADDDYLDGGMCNDLISGSQGRDILSGGHGQDRLAGGGGDDTVIPGPGHDVVFGSRGDTDRVYADFDDTLFSVEGDDVRAVTIDTSLGVDLIGVPGGSDDFADRVRSDVTTLQSFPEGQKLLEEIERGGHRVAVLESAGVSSAHIALGPGQTPFDHDRGPDGEPGPGLGTILQYNPVAPSNFSSEGIPPLVVFAHELRHASDNSNGVALNGYSMELNENGEPLIDPTTGEIVYSPNTELDTVGLSHDGPLGDDDRVTENSIREALNLPARTNYSVSIHNKPEDGSNRYAPALSDSATQNSELAPTSTVNSQASDSVRFEPTATTNQQQNDSVTPTPPGGNTYADLPRPARVPTVSTPCIDSDGDGWGWDGHKSCVMTNGVRPVAPKCVDSDGDGWGWDGHKSCLIDPIH